MFSIMSRQMQKAAAILRAIASLFLALLSRLLSHDPTARTEDLVPQLSASWQGVQAPAILDRTLQGL